MLVVYLEQVTLSAGLEMQLGVVQAMNYYSYAGLQAFYEKLLGVRLLENCKKGENNIAEIEKARKAIIDNVFREWGMDAEVSSIVRFSTMTRYEVPVKQGVLIRSLCNRRRQIEEALGIVGIQASLIPNTTSVGFEIPNDD